MWLNCCDTLDSQDGGHRNDEEEEKLFERDIKWAVDAQHSIAIEEPMSLGDCVRIPNQEESADGQNADECTLPSTQDASLENNLEPE